MLQSLKHGNAYAVLKIQVLSVLNAELQRKIYGNAHAVHSIKTASARSAADQGITDIRGGIYFGNCSV